MDIRLIDENIHCDNNRTNLLDKHQLLTNRRGKHGLRDYWCHSGWLWNAETGVGSVGVDGSFVRWFEALKVISSVSL